MTFFIPGRLQLGKETFKTKVMSNAGGTCEFNEKFTFNKKAEDTVLKVCSHWPCFTLRNDSLLYFKSARPYLRLTFTLTRLSQVEVKCIKDIETASSDKKLGSRDVDLKMQVFCGPQNAGIRKFHVDLKMQV